MDFPRASDRAARVSALPTFRPQLREAVAADLWRSQMKGVPRQPIRHQEVRQSFVCDLSGRGPAWFDSRHMKAGHRGRSPLSIAITYALTGALIVIVPVTKGEQPKSKEGDNKNRECRDKNDAHNRRQFDLEDSVRLIEFI